MNRTKKIIITVLVAIVVVAGIIVANIKHRNSPLKDIKVTIDYAGNDPLVVSETIVAQIQNAFPTMVGRPLKEVDKNSVEQIVADNPYVKESHASISLGGSLMVRCIERTPIVHVYLPLSARQAQKFDAYVLKLRGQNAENVPLRSARIVEFYLDEEGRFMPMSSDGYSYVIVANGVFREYANKGCALFDVEQLQHSKNFAQSDLVSAWKLALFLHQNPIYGDLMDQIFVDNRGDLQVSPLVGNHIVVVGSAENLDEKFLDLLSFYRNGMEKVGWDAYKQINLKYKNQVICTKRTNR